jgi:hypothetical protein
MNKPKKQNLNLLDHQKANSLKHAKQRLFSDRPAIHLEAKLKRFSATGESWKWHSRWDLPLNEYD